MFRGRKGALEGVSGRKNGLSRSALRMNCSAVSGEPFVDGVDLRERGLPEGVDNANEGRDGSLGSGVLGIDGI